ncbi:MAG: YihY/virulence factor BrkB family protein [Cyclobacteriaceae bacterium]
MDVNFIPKLRHFLRETVWNTPLNTLPKWEAFFYRQIRILMITFSEYEKDKCAEKASALTYFSLLSVVPVAAMAFGIATIFNLDQYLKSELERYFSGQQEVLDYTMQFADKMLSNSSGGVISGISAVFLIYAVARLLNNIEAAFNDVWNTKQGRTLKRKVTDYMSVIFLGPLILILSSSATVFVTKSIQDLADSSNFLGYFEPSIVFLLKLIPYTLIWFLLFLLYIVFPNASVKIRPALIAGIVAGTAYQLTQLAWIKGQVYLSNYSVIYGSFAALPLFLIWLQVSWTILLIGAELAYAIQSLSSWTYSDDDKQLSRKLKKRILFLILHKVIEGFTKNDRPMSFTEVASNMYIPNRFIHQTFHDLENAGLISRVKNEVFEGDEYYQPAMDVNKIDFHVVLRKLDLIGVESLNKLEENESFSEVDDALNQLESYGKTSLGNRLLKDL